MALISTSAPGKVMVSGAYVVLEKGRSALVFATSARFHCQVSSTPGLDKDAHKDGTRTDRRLDILVRTPQMGVKELRYRLVFSKASRLFLIVRDAEKRI